jgi:hypothetical protein
VLHIYIDVYKHNSKQEIRRKRRDARKAKGQIAAKRSRYSLELSKSDSRRKST